MSNNLWNSGTYFMGKYVFESCTVKCSLLLDDFVGLIDDRHNVFVVWYLSEIITRSVIISMRQYFESAR